MDSLNKEDLQILCNELGNTIQIELLRILNTKSCNLKELQLELENKFNKPVYRETIYKKLEKLIKLGIVKKEYNQLSKRLIYVIQVNKVALDIKNLKIGKITKNG